MSDRNVEIVRRTLEAWNRRDLSEWLDAYAPDAEVDWTRSRGPARGIYRGPDEIAGLWRDYFSAFENVQMEFTDFEELGVDVVVSTTARARGREGIEVASSGAFVFTIADGRIARLRMYQERAEALEAAGASGTTSSGNAEIVRRWFERLAAGDPGPEFCAPDIEIRNWSEMPVPGPYHGHPGLRQWWADVHEVDVLQGFRLFDLVDVHEVDGERVITTQRATGKAPYTEIDLDFEWSALVRLRDGKVVSAFGYPTPADARAAAGIHDA